MDDRHLVREVLINPSAVTGFSARQWDVFIRQARRANLLARLAYLLEQNGLTDQVPRAPLQHLQSAKRVAMRQAIAVRWEVACIEKALRDVGVRLTLLKGAAYLMADVPAAQGRIFSDVDILVPKSDIAAVESALMLHGWKSQNVTAYDQRYYRKWMHEIPPMTHIQRGTTIDVHHTILPETARLKVNTSALFDGIQPLPDGSQIAVLCPIDMLLHSATHLFHEGDFENGLRDLLDIDLMLRHESRDPQLWTRLIQRSQTLGLTRPLHFALRYSNLLLHTPVPPEVLESTYALAGMTTWQQKVLDACFTRVLRPIHLSSLDRWSGVARLFLYVRSHWLRMPLHLLVLHLARKAFTRPPQSETTESMLTSGKKNKAGHDAKTV